MSRVSTHARLQASIDDGRARIARGERPAFHVRWATAIDGSIDVTVAELPLIHQFVSDEAGVVDGARFLIARALEVEPMAFDVGADLPSHD